MTNKGYLQQLFEALDYISDLCDNIEMTTDDIIDEIRLTANGELVELHELLIKKTKWNKKQSLN